MPDERVSRERIEVLIRRYENRVQHSSAGVEGYHILLTALALYERLDAYEKWALESLGSDAWYGRGLVPRGTCLHCFAVRHKDEPHKPNCFVGRLEKLMEAPDAST